MRTVLYDPPFDAMRSLGLIGGLVVNASCSGSTIGLSGNRLPRNGCVHTDGTEVSHEIAVLRENVEMLERNRDLSSGLLTRTTFGFPALAADRNCSDGGLRR